MYETRDYMLYREKALRHEPAEAAGIAEYLQRLGVKIRNKVFTRLNRVSPADLHKPDLHKPDLHKPDLHKADLWHKIYLGLFKHMMEWVEGFLKKHKRQQAFNRAWKEMPPYTGFSIPREAHRKIT